MFGSYSAARRAIPILTALVFLVSGCALPLLPPGTGQPSTPPATAKPSEVPVATGTATSARTLTVCLGAEPNTLYPLGNPNDAAQSVLAAIDDGPIDVVNYQYQPVALTRVP